MFLKQNIANIGTVLHLRDVGQHWDANPKTVNLLVTAKFRPERFHSNVYNNYGVQRGTEGPVTKLFRVRPSGVRWLSHQYWIEQIDVIPPE